MKVVDGPFEVKDRGAVIVIDALPAALETGMTVRSGERAWIVAGIETYTTTRSHTNWKPAGLLLRGQTSMPAVGTELTIDSVFSAREFSYVWICDACDALDPGARKSMAAGFPLLACACCGAKESGRVPIGDSQLGSFKQIHAEASDRRRRWVRCPQCNARSRSARRGSGFGPLTEIPPAYCAGCGSTL